MEGMVEEQARLAERRDGGLADEGRCDESRELKSSRYVSRASFPSGIPRGQKLEGGNM